MPTKTLEILGTFEWEIAHFANGDGSGTVIGRLRDGTTIKGPAEKGALEYDLDYRFLGHWTNHHKYGRQFVFSTYVLAEPYGEIGTVKYLSRAKGIGRARAQQMWNLWGSDAIGICKHTPERMCQEIKGVTADTARNASEFFKRIEALEACTIALTELLDGRGFPKALVRQAIGRWGNRAVEEIQANPYGLMAFHGVGFARADTLYLDMGHPPEAMIRQALCIHHAITSDGDGHTWYEASFCQREINRTVGGAKVDLPAALWEAVVEQRKLLRRGVDGRTWVADRSRAKNEELVALRLRMATTEGLTWPELNAGNTPLTDHQQAEVVAATVGTVGVLAGSPGTGKTFSLAQLIKSIDPGHPVAVCAPTGKAAVRATELLAAQGVTIQATTIHRLLGVKEASEGGWKFEHGPGNPLPHKYIFVDESPMIDTDLMASLLSARRTGCRMLFVGDPNQLAPVGHGAPLRDMIAGDLPAGQLTEIHRNAGRIVKACAEIRDKHTFTPSESLDLQAGKNLVCIEKTSPQAQITELQQWLEWLESLGPGYDRIKDTYVLVAVNKKSPLGRHALNRQLQLQLNPGGRQAAGSPFRVDDKVICLKNGWCESTIEDHPEANEDNNVYVANGEIGYVVDVQPQATTVTLTEPEREVRIPRGQSNGEGDTGCDWDLAYAITTHKSQGSEAPIVFVMIDEHPGARRLMTRNWIYTGISRAKVACVLIGKLATARAVCKRDGLRRKTFLAEMIRGEIV